MKAFRTALVVLTAMSLLVACGKDKKAAPAAGSGTTSEKMEGPNADKTVVKKGEAQKAPEKLAEKPSVAKVPAKAPATREAKAEPAKAPVADKPVPEVVAIVNGVSIKSAAFKTELEKIASRGAKIPPERMTRIKENILKRIIEKELIDQEVKKQGVAVTASEIDAAFDEYKKRFRTEEQFQNYLKHGKVTVEQIRERMEAKKSLEKLIEKLGDLAVTEVEAKEFYTKNERFYVEKEGVRASHVLVKVDEKAADDKVKAAKKKIAEVQAELKKGMDFAEAAKKFSEGPSAPKGGDLGFFGRGQMVKPFEEAAFVLDIGKVSDPIRTRFGFHLIKVAEKRQERKKPFDEVKGQIMESLRNKKFFKERRSLIQKLTDSAKVEKFL